MGKISGSQTWDMYSQGLTQWACVIQILNITKKRLTLGQLLENNIKALVLLGKIVSVYLEPWAMPGSSYQ
jgi:hypothetical protein